MDKGREVDCGGKKIHAMSSLQTEANAILKSPQNTLHRRIEKLEIWADCRNIIIGLLSPLEVPPQIRTILWDITVLPNSLVSFTVINVSRKKGY